MLQSFAVTLCESVGGNGLKLSDADAEDSDSYDAVYVSRVSCNCRYHL